MTPPLPPLTPPLFLPFTQLPILSPSPSPSSNISPQKPSHYLLATISENMTLSTSPTFILKDILGDSFAVTLKIPNELVKEGVQGGGWDVSGFKKGWTMVVPEARVKGRKEGDMGEGGEGRMGFVECGVRDVWIIPTSVERLYEISRREQEREEMEEGQERCQGCGLVKAGDELSRCKGCASVWYCNKDCQRRGWSSEGHKSECKIFKTTKEVLG